MNHSDLLLTRIAIACCCRGPHHLMRLFVFLAALLGSSLVAQFPDPPQKMDSGKPLYPFGPSDFVNVELGRVKPRFFVGEPIVIPLRLINHTRFPVTVETNTNPRSMLKAEIKPSEQRRRTYEGPYIPGMYGPESFPLDSLAERTINFLLWADRDADNSLALDEPGHYTIFLELTIRVAESGVSGPVRLRPIELEIVPTPPAFAGLIDLLKPNQGFTLLQQRRLTPDLYPKREQLTKGFPPSPLLPYLAYAAANEMILTWRSDKRNKAALDEGLLYLQMAAYSDSVFKRDAQFDLLSIFDELNQTQAAIKIALRIAETLEPDEIGKLGSHKLLQKYLLNSRELSLQKSWSLLE